MAAEKININPNYNSLSIAKVLPDAFKPSVTIKAIAIKNNRGDTLPPVLEAVQLGYERLETARKRLIASDLSPNEAWHRLSAVAKEVEEALTEKVEHYKNDLQQQYDEFEASVNDLSKVENPGDIQRQLSWQQHLLSLPKSKARSLALKDSTLAAAVLQLPEGIRSELGFTNDSISPLKETLLEGYTTEIKRFKTLIDNANDMQLRLKSDMGKIHRSPEARRGNEQAASLENL